MNDPCLIIAHPLKQESQTSGPPDAKSKLLKLLLKLQHFVLFIKFNLLLWPKEPSLFMDGKHLKK